MADIARITEVIEPEVKALGFDLVRVRMFKGGEIGDEEHTLQIMAERPEPANWLLKTAQRCRGVFLTVSMNSKMLVRI